MERLSLPRVKDEEGREVDKDCDAEEDFMGMFIGAFIDARGTPQREQTADEVRPSGFRLLQTSHSQYSTSLVVEGLDVGWSVSDLASDECDIEGAGGEWR